MFTLRCYVTDSRKKSNNNVKCCTKDPYLNAIYSKLLKIVYIFYSIKNENGGKNTKIHNKHILGLNH